MQKTFAALRLDLPGKQPLARLAQFLDPQPILGGELLLELFSEALRERRAETGGGDRDLKRTSLHHGTVIKITAGGIVHDVAEHTAPPRELEDFFVQLSG